MDSSDCQVWKGMGGGGKLIEGINGDGKEINLIKKVNIS